MQQDNDKDFTGNDYGVTPEGSFGAAAPSRAYRSRIPDGGLDYGGERELFLIEEQNDYSSRAKKRNLSANGVVLVLLLFLIALTAIPYGAVEIWWESLFQIGVFTLASIWLVSSYLKGDLRLKGSALLIPAAILILYCWLQTLPLAVLINRPSAAAASLNRPLWLAISWDPYETQIQAIKFTSFLVVLALLRTLVITAPRLRLLVWTIIGVGVCSALFGIFRQTTQRSDGFILPFLLYKSSGYGQFINRNHFALLMEMVFGLTLGLFIGHFRRDRALLYLGAMLPVATGLILANSRGGIISMVVQLLISSIFFVVGLSRESGHIRSTVRFYWLKRIIRMPFVQFSLVVCLVLVMLLGILWVGGESLVNRFAADPSQAESLQTAADTSGASRANIWKATLDVIKANPLFGVGFGGYWVALSQYHKASGYATPLQAHNDYLEAIACGGIVGAALVAWFLLSLFNEVRRSGDTKSSFHLSARSGAVIGLVGVAAHSFVDFGLHITLNALVCLSLIVLATTRLEHDPKKYRRRTSDGPIFKSHRERIRSGAQSDEESGADERT